MKNAVTEQKKNTLEVLTADWRKQNRSVIWTQDKGKQPN